MRIRAAVTAAALLSVGACTEPPPAPEPQATEVPEELRAPAAAPAAGPAGQQSAGSPMAERVATIGVLNKRNNLTQDLEMRPGETRRLGNLIVRLSACERTAPWEVPPETGAFAQVLVFERADGQSQPGWRQVFSGWLFKNSPSLNVVEHPIYDVWVKDCAMSFPGEAAPEAEAEDEDEDGEADAPRRPAATPSPAVTPAAPSA